MQIGRQERRMSKSARKLERKLAVVVAWLERNDVKVKSGDLNEVLTLAYSKLGRTYARKKRSLSGAHAHVSNVLKWIGADKKSLLSASGGEKGARRDHASIKTFYSSYEWRKVRYQALLRNGGRCEACGASSKDGATLNVDHIRPVKKYWALRMDIDNLQVLCGACNHGKANWDETDWRATENEPRLSVLMGESV